MDSVIKVPGKMKGELLAPCKDPEGRGLRIERDDGEGWEVPSEDQVKHLNMFVAGYYNGAPSRNWRAAPGMRYGTCKEGIFVAEAHTKRFFGICRSNASVSLKNEVPDLVPAFIPGVMQSGMKQSTGEESSTDRFLSRMMTQLPTISDEMRNQVMKATFEKADANRNGTLSRPEVASMFRKVVNTMSAREVEEIMMEADRDSNRQISYQEFVDWLQTSAPEKVRGKIQSRLNTEADVVKASFRVWDRNGDGLISRKELERMLTKICKEFTKQQVHSMCDVIDADDDGNIDYDEFVDFLFHTFRGRS